MNIDSRRLVGVKAERVTDVSSRDFPGHYPGEDNSWSLEKFNQNLKLKIHRVSNRSIDFDLVGVDASIANAFRRIMIAEVPTVAVESVYVYNNTSVVADEILSQRIGLIPLKVDPTLMEMRVGDEATDRNTLVFSLNIACTRRKDAPKDSTDPAELYENHELLSSALVWEPAGEQNDIEVTLHAVKGVGKDHAKFSPVATASYRLLPHINILKPIPPHLADKFQKCFSPGVIRVDPRTKAVSVDPKGVREDTVSREVLRKPEFDGYVELGRVRDHFLFNVESESAYPPQRLLLEAIAVMREKISSIKSAAEALLDQPTDGDITMGDS
ncbi:DNA-directed RNA polymerase [Mycena amicta]|nr:DNA-directed RNA polymerase [Mycena amicta]